MVKTMVRSFLLIALGLLGPVARATHVLGGEMYYDRLAGNQYRITLKLYRDCGPGNVNGTGFDAQAILAVYDGGGAFQFQQNVEFPGEQDVEVDLSNPCLIAPETVCATWTEYVTIMDLPPNSTGYVVSYQRCCRTPTMINLPTGLLQGLTCTVQIPPAATGVNSSPRFNDYPPIVMCLGQEMAFDHSATDPDGDDLVYDLFTPFAGGSDINPAPVASAPPYAGILWAPGYSAADPMDGSPGLAIDATTGAMTVQPTLLGSFTVGVRVREFRNGVLLSASIRDVRLDVVPCDATIISAIGQQGERCVGLTLDLANNSTNASFWHWDFGVPGIDADTSDMAAPTWTYSEPGTYVVTLIANPGWPCADTTVSSFAMHPPLDPVFVRPPVACVGAPVVFEATGQFTTNATVTWDFGDDAAPVTALGAVASTTYSAPGTDAVQLTVQEFGCEATYTDSATVFPRPAVEWSTDSAGCVGSEFTFTADGEAWTPLSFRWDLGDGTQLSGPAAVHVYGTPGTYDVSLTASTDAGCVESRAIQLPDRVEVFPRPLALFTVHPAEVSLLDPVVAITDRSEGAVAWSYSMGDGPVLGATTEYTFPDAGRYEITQIVTSGSNCTDTLTLPVFVSDHLFHAPTAFTPDGDGVNDEFLPVVKGARLYEMVIMDRWGAERFRTTDPAHGWSGDAQPQGVYTYLVRLAEYGPYRKEYRGHFTLLR